MFGRKILEEIGKKISDVVATSPAKDIEKNIKAVLTSVLARLDVVTREDFNLQQEICTQTRKALSDITARLDQLEAKLGNNKAVNADSLTQTKRKLKLSRQGLDRKLTKTNSTTKLTKKIESDPISKQ